MLQQAFKPFVFNELNGATYKSSFPTLSFDNFRSNKFQKSSEAYLKQNYGFREPLTRFYNQCLWSLFRYSNVEQKKRICISDDQWLFEPWTVEEYYQSCSYRYAEDSLTMAQIFEAEAKRLYQIQKILEPYGTHLFIALLPGKNLVCQEHMPKNTQYFKEKKITAFDFYGNHFQKKGINHINLGKWFVQSKDKTDYPLFPQTGTHWSNLAAMHVADTLLSYMEQLGDFKLMHFSIGKPFEKTVKPDDDLESLMNLMFDLKKKPNYYAQTTIIPDSTIDKPKLITIGDSFYWNIINATPFGHAFGSHEYWYYFNSVYFDESATNILEKDVLQEVLSADFVMLSYATTQLYGMSNGFSSKILLELCYEQEEVDACMESLRKAIENDQKWMAALEHRAVENGTCLEQELTSEAQYLINLKMESYFPALMDSIPTKRSLKARYLMGDSLAFVEYEVNKVIRSIKSSPEKLDEMQQKAVSFGLDLETMILYDARWIVDYHINDGTLVYQGMPKNIKKQENYGIQQ